MEFVINNRLIIRDLCIIGVKSAKDAAWRKKNGFDRCVSQSGGKGSAVKYSVSKINEWLTNGKVSKNRQR